MKKLVYGSKRDEYLSNLSHDRVHHYTPNSDFEDLESRSSDLLVDSIIVFFQVDSYKKNQRKWVKEVLEMDDQCILLAENKEDVADSIVDAVDNVKQMGETKTDGFFKKLTPVMSQDYTEEQLDDMKQLPSKIIIENIATVDRRRFPEMNEIVDFVNKRLFDVNDEILHSYLAEKVYLPDKTLFYGDSDEKNFKNLIDRLMELEEEMSRQEIERNVKVLTLKHFEHIDLSKSFKLKMTGGREEPLYEVSESTSKSMSLV